MKRLGWLCVILLVGCGNTTDFVTPTPVATNALQIVSHTPTPTSFIPFPPTVAAAVTSVGGIASAVAPVVPAPPTPVPIRTPTAIAPLPTATAAATNTPVPVPTLTLAQAAASYPAVDAADVAKRPDFYKDKKFRVTGSISDVQEKDGVTAFSINVDTAAGSTAHIAIGYRGTDTSIQEGVHLTAYCVGVGTISGQNAFGATISEAAARADYIGPAT